MTNLTLKKTSIKKNFDKNKSIYNIKYVNLIALLNKI